MEDALFLFRSIYISYTMPTAVAFFSASIKQVCISHSAWCVCPTRSSGYLPPARGVVPHLERGLSQHPERGVPVHLERGVLPHPVQGLPPHPVQGLLLHPERGVLPHPARDLSPAAAPQNRFTVRASFPASFAGSKTRSEQQIHSICQIPFLPFAINRKRFCRKSNFAAALKRV